MCEACSSLSFKQAWMLLFQYCGHGLQFPLIFRVQWEQVEVLVGTMTLEKYGDDKSEAQKVLYKESLLCLV